MADESPYVIVSGKGDLAHQVKINEVARKGYKVVSSVFNPEGQTEVGRLVVIMGLVGTHWS
jgi:hypothetical protein